MKTIAYYSGKIEAGTWQRDVLPENLKWDVRNDSLFISLFFAVLISFAVLGIFKIKVFGRTLAEYIQPIWYFIAGSIVVVFSQYIWVVPSGNIALWGRVTQILWEVMVGASAYLMIKKKNFGYRNLFFLGVLYSFIIHGLKVSIRYFFYGSTLWYVADRFLYGSLLVMAVAFGFGSLLLFFRRRGDIKF